MRVVSGARGGSAGTCGPCRAASFELTRAPTRLFSECWSRRGICGHFYACEAPLEGRLRSPLRVLKKSMPQNCVSQKQETQHLDVRNRYGNTGNSLVVHKRPLVTSRREMNELGERGHTHIGQSVFRRRARKRFPMPGLSRGRRLSQFAASGSGTSDATDGAQRKHPRSSANCTPRAFRRASEVFFAWCPPVSRLTCGRASARDTCWRRSPSAACGIAPQRAAGAPTPRRPSGPPRWCAPRGRPRRAARGRRPVRRRCDPGRPSP